jgi:hypothetical protein
LRSILLAKETTVSCLYAQLSMAAYERDGEPYEASKLSESLDLADRRGHCRFLL